MTASTRIWVAAGLSAVLGLGGVAWGVSQRTGSAGSGDSASGVLVERGFAEPEEAFRWYLTEFLAGRPESGAQVCGAITAPQHADSLATIARNRMVSLYDPLFATQFPAYTPFNVASMRSTCAPSPVAYGVLHGWDNVTVTRPVADEAEARELLDSLSPAVFDGAQIIELDVLGQITATASDAPDSSMAGRTEMYGAEEIAEVAALIDVDGETFATSARLGRYGERWVMLTRYAAAFGTPMEGFEAATSVDYADRVAGTQRLYSGE
ncbi:MAG: hypothetical protein ACTMIR_09755 [Cellulomonadaceae bacterium]